MTLTVLASVRGSPGVTTTALLVAGCLTSGVLVEADLDGGVLAVRHGLGREPGLTTLAAERGATGKGLMRHSQNACGVPALVGPESVKRARALWLRAGQALVDGLVGADAEVVVDAGRIATRPAADDLFAKAAQVWLVVRTEADQLVTLAHHLDDLRDNVQSLGVVLVGHAPYRGSDIAQQLDVDVVGVIPYDPRAAADLEGRTVVSGHLRRSRLAVAARGLASRISQRGQATRDLTPEQQEVLA